jgi:DNA-binding transcriptional MerR regulator
MNAALDFLSDDVMTTGSEAASGAASDTVSDTISGAQTVPGVQYALGNMDIVSDEIQAPMDAGHELMTSLQSIPDKMAFKIGEAADMVRVKQYVLRYWESEFDALRPKKSKNGQRVYSRRDVETALMIKKLLYTDRFSIEGARAALKNLKSQVKEEKAFKTMAHSQEHTLEALTSLVEEIRRIRLVLG